MIAISERLTSSGSLLGFRLMIDGEATNELLSRQDLMDFVDSDAKVQLSNGSKQDINVYLGESTCFGARVSQSSYNPY